MKFLMEITEKGFEQYEFLSRMLYYKKDPDRMIAWVAGHKRISDAQGVQLMNCSTWLRGKNWKKVFANEDQQYAWVVESVQQAMYSTKKILNKTISEDNFVKNQLRQVFMLFTQHAGQTDEQLKLAESIHGYQEPVIQFGDIYNFLCFLTVNDAEREQKAMELVNEMEPIVKKLR